MNGTKTPAIPSTKPEVRPLEAGEEPLFLNLVADWPFNDDRRGEEFFARPMDQDPRFAIGDIFGAHEQGSLLSCCQIFPRTLRIAGEPVRVAGIGTVFTRASVRGRGIAPLVVEAALSASRQRGFQLAMLTANRFGWYESMGFARWGHGKVQLVLAQGVDQPRLLGPSLEMRQFEPSEHLAQVKDLSSHYCADRHGTLLRDDDAWLASLALAGNPVEEFLVVEDPLLHEVVVYLRACVMNGAWQLLEWGYAPGYAQHLAELIATTVRTVAQDRVLAPRLADPELERFLQERGLKERGLADGAPEWMVRCLDGDGLAGMFGLTQANDSAPNDVVNILMPPAAFHFWTSDRF